MACFCVIGSLPFPLSALLTFFYLQDVWQGTQLLAIDSAAAVELLRRSLIGDELTEKEKKALRRTMTDLASVIPIGILMLLPVSKKYPNKEVYIHFFFLFWSCHTFFLNYSKLDL